MAEKLLTSDDIKFLFNELRKASVIWEGRKEVLRLARKKVFVRRSKKSGKAIYKYYWQCAICFQWYKNPADIEVDHIEEIGGITGFTGDWNETISKMFPRPVSEHLQVACIPCHQKKTKKFLCAAKKYVRR